MDVAPTNTTPEQERHLAPESEWRFEVEFGRSVEVTLLEGTAEIYGSELPPRQPFTFSGGTKLAVFSWHGCVLRVEDLAACRAESVASDTKHMVAYLNTHVALENRRNKAAAAAAIALANGQPLGGTVNIAIVGERDVGKTTVARLLTAYALKGGRKPLFVDLDPSAGTLALATSIGAVVVDRMDVTETTGISITASPPLLYSFGHESPRENVGAYRKILDKLASMCIRRLEKEQTVRDSGMIIDTHAWNEATGTDDLLHLVDAFRVDVVLVVGSDAVFGEVNRVFADQGRTAAVVKLPKSGGSVDRDKTYRRQMQIQRIREYFYGTPKFELAPYTTSVAFHEITVMRIGESKLASPASVVAAVADKDPDASTSAGDSHLLKIDSFTVLLNSVLAVSNAELEVDAGEEELEEILQTNIAGFVYVSSVDEKRKRIHLLMPNPGRLPKRFLWMGSLRWTEHQ